MANVDCNSGPRTKSPPAGSHTSTRAEQTFSLPLTQGQIPPPTLRRKRTHTHTHKSFWYDIAVILMQISQMMLLNRFLIMH